MPNDFVIADVFTSARFGGNQLAVLPDARGLSGAAMQAIAREFNFSETTFVLSETTFVLPPNAPGADFQLRIFTPRAELPFAGHPTIGSAAVLAFNGMVAAKDNESEVVFEEGAGLVRTAIRAGEKTIWARLSIAAAPRMPGGEPEAADIAAVLSLPADAVLGHFFGGIGNPFCFMHLASPDAVDSAVLDRAAWSRHLQATWAPQVYFFAGSPEQGQLYARMFAPAFGIDEDPATGSGAAILAGCLAARRTEADVNVSLDITQGVLMGRPSRLEASAIKTGGRVRSVGVAGETVIVAAGQLRDS